MCIPLSVVSRRHCELYTEFEKLHVRDLKSSNGTHVNDESIEEAVLKAGDILQIGPIKFIIQIDGIPENFDKYLPSPQERTAAPVETTSEETEIQEADFDQVIMDEDLPDAIGGESQTMDIDNIFNNGLGDDEDFDLG